ncbi:MAG: sulfotransferase family protein [Candidatus Latescibacteria bacterium]|nr:sulfotransferase family protein [Candidatus Latescibacterota bacterium]
MIDPDTIVVVSGLPRSGTSMMMQMIEAGGMDVLTDGLRTADEDNLKGYFEYENVKALKSDRNWLPEARGKAVKIISELLKYLPETHTYRIIFMRRDLEEVLASQDRMLVRRGVQPGGQAENAEIARVFRRHLQQTEAWLSGRPGFRTLYAEHRQILADPAREAARVNAFLDHRLDEAAMAASVDGSLYRQRR